MRIDGQRQIDKQELGHIGRRIAITFLSLTAVSAVLNLLLAATSMDSVDIVPLLQSSLESLAILLTRIRDMNRHVIAEFLGDLFKSESSRFREVQVYHYGSISTELCRDIRGTHLPGRKTAHQQITTRKYFQPTVAKPMGAVCSSMMVAAN